MARPPDETDGEAVHSSPTFAGADTVAVPLVARSSTPNNVYKVQPGSVIASKYRVVRIIGKGGMGIVAEAEHMALDARVAIKFLLPEYMSFSEASERFLREARAASKLKSQHVTRVLDVATLGSGEPYLVMEFLEGEDLATHAHKGDLISVEDAVDFIAQAGDAIAEAHASGIIHRDLKPANLFLARKPDNTPLIKVLDFGISKVIGEGTSEVALTHTTTIIGSALYMSPEQMKSSKYVDQRADVYSLGVCLYEILGRGLPFAADTFPELCAKVFTKPPHPLKELRPEVPEGLVEVIEKALSREPEDRFQSVPEMLHSLSPYARPTTRAAIEALVRRHAPEIADSPTFSGASKKGSSKDAAPREEKRKRRGLVLFFAIAAALGGLGAFFVFQKPLDLRGLFGGAPPAPSVTASESAAPTQPAPPSASVAFTALTEKADAQAPEPLDASVEDAGELDASLAAAAEGDAGVNDAGDAGTSDAGTSDAGTSDAGTSDAGPRAVATTAPRPPKTAPVNDTPVATAPPAVTTSATATVPQIPLGGSGLDVERCFATMPDGTKKEVPCN